MSTIRDSALELLKTTAELLASKFEDQGADLAAMTARAKRAEDGLDHFRKIIDMSTKERMGWQDRAEKAERERDEAIHNRNGFENAAHNWSEDYARVRERAEASESRAKELEKELAQTQRDKKANAELWVDAEKRVEIAEVRVDELEAEIALLNEAAHDRVESYRAAEARCKTLEKECEASCKALSALEGLREDRIRQYESRLAEVEAQAGAMRECLDWIAKLKHGTVPNDFRRMAESGRDSTDAGRAFLDRLRTYEAALLKMLDGCFCDDYGQAECVSCGIIRKALAAKSSP